jgi:hypothetical protein
LDILVAMVGLILWLTLLIFQLADLCASLLDVRIARYSDENAEHPHIRFSRYFWIFPIGACLGVAVILGVDLAGRLIFLLAQPIEGVIILLGLTASTLIVAALIVIVIANGHVVSYSSLAAALREQGSTRVTKKQLDEYRRQLAEISARNTPPRSDSRNSRGQRDLRKRVDALAREFRLDPPSGLSAIDAVRWAWSARFLFGASSWRLIPAVIGLVPISAIVLGGSALVTFGGVPLIVLLLVPTPMSLLIALAAARSSLAVTATGVATTQTARIEVEQLLSTLERSSRRGVAGLGERVARALQILREQQG